MPGKNLNDKLKRFSSQLTSRDNSKSQAKYPERYELLADHLHGELVAGPSGCYCLVRTFFPTGYTHGLNELKMEDIGKILPAAAFSIHDGSLSYPLKSMKFLDTETTGLGGSGTVAFLIGMGHLVEEGFEVLQYIIPDFSDEAAMLQDFYETLNVDSTIVSFNGASFDVPVIQDRLIINRVARKLEFGHHLDVLHSARRLFKRRLQDCTLMNLERQLLSFYRTDDIPGYLVPSVYFEWLSSQELSMMSAVLEHNRHDIISLLFLTQLIAEAFVSTGETLEHSEDLHSLSRFFERRKESTKVERIYDRVEESGTEITPDAALHFARNFKRTQKFERSVTIWESLVEARSVQGYWACVELAKYHEHQTKEIKTALDYARLASTRNALSDLQIGRLNKRIQRLSKKLNTFDEN